MSVAPNSIALIGMPGAGKSTVGVVLAKRAALGFVDTDVLIQQTEGRSLQAIVQSEGHLALRSIEARSIRHLDVQRHVISTGGSVVYSDEAMQRLRAISRIVYLEVDLPTLEQRVGDFSQRGLAKAPGTSFAELYAERLPLYEKYADITVPATRISPEAIADTILAKLGAS